MGEFKDTISHMCLAGALVIPWSLTQEKTGWQVRALIMKSIFSLNSLNSLETFRKNSNGMAMFHTGRH